MREGETYCERRVVWRTSSFFTLLLSLSDSAPSIARRSARSLSDNDSPATSVGGGEGGVVPGKRVGIEVPGERKKSVGEAKESKHPAGAAKRSCFSACKCGSVNGALDAI